MSRLSQYVDRTPPRIDHCQAICTECGWMYYGRAGLERLQEAVRYHVRTHRHTVNVRSIRMVTYNPKDPA